MVRSRRYRRHQFGREIREQARRLYPLDNCHGLLAVTADFAVLGAAIAATLASGWALYPLAILVIGSRQRALATILHEAAHGTLARSRTLSFVLGTFFSGYLVFSTLFSYRQSHVVRHHGKFGDPELDDDYRYMLTKGVYAKSSPIGYVLRIFVRPLLLLDVPSYLLYVIRSRLLPTTSNGGLECLLMIGYWAALVMTAVHFQVFDEVVLFWIVPFLTSFQVIGWFIELAEHAPLMEKSVDIEMTRNRNSHWLEMLLTGMHGENYHLAHHLWPRVPFWRMRELHQILLADSEYARLDRCAGGIFLSSNRAPSVLTELLGHVVANGKVSADFSALGGQ